MKLTTIFGPPGTGKTTELIKIAHEKCMTQKGLLLSYTKAAAMEIAGRVNAGDLRASTLHSLAFQRLGMNRASVVDLAKLRDFSTQSGIPFKGADGAEGLEEGDEYLSIVSYAKNRLMGDKDAYDQYGRPGTPARFKMFCESYEQWKSTYGYMDFDDMLIRASKLKFTNVPVVILDEAQDCSPLQWSVFEQVCKGAREVFIAGDDDQAIYEWSGADPHGMANFPDRLGAMFRGGAFHVDVRVLDRSWRLPRNVFNPANKLVGQIDRRQKKVWTHADKEGVYQRTGDTEMILPRLPKFNLLAADGDALILARDNFRLREIQTALHNERMPYAMATSNGPYENRYAKALRGYFREAAPEDDEREAMMNVGTMECNKLAGERHWKALRAMPVRRLFAFPHRLRDFYWDLCDRPDVLFQPLCIRLSTIHQAKGGEADVVVLDLSMTPRVESGIDLNRDAEVRVWYVGMTRARHELHLCGENPLL